MLPVIPGLWNADPSMHKVAVQRRRNALEITSLKFINDAHGNLLTRDGEICKRWKECGEQCLNEEYPRTDFYDLESHEEEIPGIKIEEVKSAVKQMKINKAVEPDQIPSELRKELVGVGFLFLVTFFNKILHDSSMSEAFRMSFFLPLYKGKGDPKSCMDFRAIKLM